MESCRNLPDLKLNVIEDHNDVLRLLEVIKPDWDKKKVQIKVLSGGYSCCMLRCSSNSGESVTVRVRNVLEGLVNPLHERQVLKVMSEKGYFPKLLALFQNGFCYEYIPGNTFVTKESEELIITEEQLRLIAEEMANIHSVIIPEFDYSKTSYFDFGFEILSTAKPWFEGCPSNKELEEEFGFVIELAAVAQSPLVLNHGDAQPANFVWNEEKKKVTFVDWEATRVAPRGVDIACFLHSVEIFGNLYNIPVSTPPDMTKKFCQHYLQQWNKICNKPPPTAEELEQLLLEVKYYTVVVKLFWLICFVKFDTIMLGFGDIERTWKFQLERYFDSKEELLGFRSFGRLPS